MDYQQIQAAMVAEKSPMNLNYHRGLAVVDLFWFFNIHLLQQSAFSAS